MSHSALLGAVQKHIVPTDRVTVRNDDIEDRGDASNARFQEFQSAKLPSINSTPSFRSDSARSGERTRARNDSRATACAFDLLMLNGDDVRKKPFAERKAMLRKVLRRTHNGVQYVEHTEGDGAGMFKAACKLGLEGIVSKKVDAPYRSDPSRTWIKVKNPKAPAASRATDGTF